jgi:pimeloyl-ACP methyl ester carboxylesterase
MKAEPFEIAIPEADLDDLRARLDATRWADDLGNDDWRYGVERRWLEEMVRYWRYDYDWRAQERELNRFPNYRVTLDGIPLHFVHARGEGENRIPLLLIHGWPWTFDDFHAMLDPLSNPATHGGAIGDGFDVIVPSLPGFGFSTPLARTGMTVPRLAELLRVLMTEVLGYSRFGVAGGDWGAVISLQLAHTYSEDVVGVFTTIPVFPGVNILGITPDQHAPDEQWMLIRKAQTQNAIISHYTVQSHDPQTLAYALMDSPVGTAAWLWERRRSWSDCGGDVLTAFSRDFLCTSASIYWLTGTIGSSLRIYWDNFHSTTGRTAHDRMPVIEVPAGFAIHPKEVMLVPRSVAEAGTNLQRWSLMPRGGHFGFSEQPAAMTDELREFFRPLRQRRSHASNVRSNSCQF